MPAGSVVRGEESFSIAALKKQAIQNMDRRPPDQYHFWQVFMTDIQFSLVVPSYNERGNIDKLVTDIHRAFEPSDISYELILVDDNSPDGTADRARELAEDYPVVVHQRAGKLGLATAVMEGWELARGSVLGVTDADLSHDISCLPAMVSSVLNQDVELAVGSRYVPGGGVGNWPLKREIISRCAVMMARPICPVADLTSGFFVCHRSVVEGVKLNPIGFKIGLEVMMRGRYHRFTEVPYVFQDRDHGASKLGTGVVLSYLKQLFQLIAYWVKNRPKRVRVAWPTESIQEEREPALEPSEQYVAS
jgi:dolichol-phosphate mannosyltransferase